MSDRKECRLGDCIEFIIDNRGKNPPLSDNGYELIETNMISSNNKYPDFDKVTKYVSEDTYNNWFRKGHPKIGDILISTVGNIGKVAIVNEDKGCIAQNLIGLRVNEKIIAEYLYYFLIKKDTQDQLLALNIGSVQPSIKVPHLLNLEIKIPELLKQKECIQVLSKLDDKIQLNTQINQTLEQIAQALFKSWFVDFDPVRAKAKALSDGMSLEQAELAAMQTISGKTPEELTALSQTQPDRYAELAETAKAFPCEMVEVDGVEVPKGWGVKPIELILDRLKNKQKLRKEEISFEGTIPVFEQGTSILMGYHDKDAAFNASIDEPIFIFGDHTCITKLSTIPFSIYQNVIPLIGKNLPTYWVYCAIQNKQTFQEYRRHWAELIVKEVVVPDNINLCQCFSKKVKELFFKIDINHQENRTLIETRDLLLPRLLNGEI
ncbi:TPA: restriction endonuclease subunit S [Haemophilus influenzae 10810]|uniref:restriction endonuclease subunit S n=1 Tax=Haemophilus influenzae TaxID=727 RepID=UPI000E333A1C|nr:restriction endonuclease subunit S [Haemophilus influenzae]AXP41841.1 restriction endonuclease subunit S [Haemophilus influenzae]AXP58173.1 restriction endonuclease subunit S [Haemophilus influenzae]MCK9624188.1 restriction endonuclease subunit S [Haemophilus influenzae]RFO83274.1 restriction endonuclease subunit S [Haemophilus influenzae]